MVRRDICFRLRSSSETQGSYTEPMAMWCILCESELPAETSLATVTLTMPGTICVACGSLSAAERDVLRSLAMTRILREGW